jgi:hypothetical protein
MADSRLQAELAEKILALQESTKGNTFRSQVCV